MHDFRGALHADGYTSFGSGRDSNAYLRAVLARIADHPVNRIDDLLPWTPAAPPAPDTPEIPALAA